MVKLHAVDKPEARFHIHKDVDSEEMHMHAMTLYSNSTIMADRWIEAVRYLRSKKCRRGWVMDQL